jgi:hypothetical protein
MYIEKSRRYALSVLKQLKQWNESMSMRDNQRQVHTEVCWQFLKNFFPRQRSSSVDFVPVKESWVGNCAVRLVMEMS